MVYNIKGRIDERLLVEKLAKISNKTYWFSVNKKDKKIKIVFNFYVDPYFELRKIFPEEIARKLARNAEKILKKVVCYIHKDLGILEIDRGDDFITRFLEKIFERVLENKIERLTLSPLELIKIIRKHSEELTQAYFFNVDGFFYKCLKGRRLENNIRFLMELKKFGNCLKVITIRPKIFFENGFKYQVTINGEKGCLKFCRNDEKPRNEINQLLFILKSVKNESLLRY